MKRALLCIALIASACRHDMAERSERRPLGSSPFFPDRSASRPLVADTVPRGEFSGMPVTIARGRQRFAIYCAPCHGVNGDGNGVIVRHGFPRPPSFATLALTPEIIVKTIAVGYGTMYGYADRVPPNDRLAIAAHVRTLERQ